MIATLFMKDTERNVLEGEYADQSEDLKETFGDFSIRATCRYSPGAISKNQAVTAPRASWGPAITYPLHWPN
jgi:hypothetical protein